MFRKALYLSAIVIFTACHSSKKAASSVMPAAGTTITTPENPNADGSSYEKAIVIMETSESKGVSAEYAWIKKNYPGYQTQGQALTTHDKKPYDILTIKNSEGDEKKVYFDISNFFGKW